MAKEREKEAREIPKSIFLSKLRIQDFGVISNETLHFDQGVNELIELPENGNVGTYVLKAIEILLWPARSESEPRAFRDEALQASWGETTSYIMGTFESRRIYGKVDRSDHVRHSISVAIGGRIGKHAVYAWHEIPHDGPDVTGFFEKHGWHSASAIYLSKNMLIGGCRLPMEFFSGQLHKLDYLKEYRTSVDLLDSETVPFTDANELKESNKCRLDKAKFQAGTLGMEEFRRSLEPLLYYSTLKKLRDSANKFKLTITKKESELHAQERSQRRRLTTRRKEMITKLGFVESASPPKLSRLSKLCNATLRDTRRRLKEEHKKKTNALRILAAAENVDDRIDRHDSLKEAIEKNLSELLDKRTLLTKVETERQQKASRLKLVKDHVVPLGTSGRFSEGIRSKINFLEERASTVGGEKSSAEAAIKKLEERRAGIVAERLQVEERLRKREEDLTKLIRQELMAQKAVNEAREDRERESGNAAKLERFTPQEEHEPRGNEDSPADRSRLSRESTQVLMMMNSSIRAKFNSNDGFFGAVFDHIDVKEEHHCLLRTIESFLATFLVRDREVATILREHIQLEKIESTVTLISFDDFNRLPEKYPIPNKTTPLSTYLKVKDTGPHKLPSLPLVNKLTDIIGWELRKHVVIEGNPEESSAAASKFLEDPEWESFTFIARDGTCFTNNARNEPATDGSVLKAYNKIRGYWESKQLELTSRLEEYRLCNHQRTEVNAEVLSILEETRKNLQEIDQVQRDLHWHHSAWNRLDRESRIIQRELDKLKKQHIATRSTDSDRLERSITSLDNTIEQLKNEIRVLDDASSSLIMQMAENLIAVASRNEKYKRRDILQSEIDVFKAQFEETENFIHDYEELEYEEVDDTTLAVDEDASRYEAETPLYQTRIFLLRQKLAEAQGKVGELEVKGREAGFDPNVDPARKLREMIRTQNMNLPPVSEQSRQRLLDNLGRAGQVDDVPEFSESRISRIPTLLNVADFVPTEQESLRNTLLCFKRVLEELGVSQGIMISEEHELPSGEVARRLRPPHDNRPFDEKRAFVELDFGPAAASPKRPKWTHNNEPLILALVARAMLHIPRFLLVDDQDVSLASLWDPVQERFFSEFRDTCQIIILSHDQSEERPYEFDKRIQL